MIFPSQEKKRLSYDYPLMIPYYLRSPVFWNVFCRSLWMTVEVKKAQRDPRRSHFVLLSYGCRFHFETLAIKTKPLQRY